MGLAKEPVGTTHRVRPHSGDGQRERGVGWVEASKVGGGGWRMRTFVIGSIKNKERNRIQ